MQPRRDLRLTTKVGQRLPRPDEHVLGELVGLRHVRGEPQTERVHPGRVRPVECLERVTVGALRVLRQRAVARIGDALIERVSMVRQQERARHDCGLDAARTETV
jgi:hypothetical protein